MKTRQDFIERAIRDAERRFALPRDWWGTWTEIHAPLPSKVVLRWSARCWVLRDGSGGVSRHDSRANAIAKARKHAAHGSRRSG